MNSSFPVERQEIAETPAVNGDAPWSARKTLLFVVGTNLVGWAVIVASASMLFS